MWKTQVDFLDMKIKFKKPIGRWNRLLELRCESVNGTESLKEWPPNTVDRSKMGGNVNEWLESRWHWKKAEHRLDLSFGTEVLDLLKIFLHHHRSEPHLC